MDWMLQDSSSRHPQSLCFSLHDHLFLMHAEKSITHYCLQTDAPLEDFRMEMVEEMALARVGI